MRTRQQPCRASLLCLPDGILELILKPLALHEKAHAHSVCRKFNSILRKPTAGACLYNDLAIDIDNPYLTGISVREAGLSRHGSHTLGRYKNSDSLQDSVQWPM